MNMPQTINFGNITEKTKDEKIEETIKGPSPKEKSGEKLLLPTEEIEKMISEVTKIAATNEKELNCIVIGNDGTGKTGIVIDYLETLPKKSLVIDLDGSATKLIRVYHKSSYEKGKIIPLAPLKMEENAETQDVTINYVQTFAKLKAMIKYVVDRKENFSAIVLDGISDLLKYAENQMRLEKNINADGGVNYQYWKNRNQKFTETIEAMRHIPGIDKFYIGHEDFIISKESASVRVKMNQMMQQRIICRKKETALSGGGNLIEFIAKIDKSKYNIALEGKEVIFSSIKAGEYKWDTSKIFEGF